MNEPRDTLFTIRLTEQESAMLDKARELSGMRSKSDLLRFLVTEYVREFYEVEK